MIAPTKANATYAARTLSLLTKGPKEVIVGISLVHVTARCNAKTSKPFHREKVRAAVARAVAAAQSVVKNSLNQHVEESLNKFAQTCADDARSSFVSRRLLRPCLASGLRPRIFSVRGARTVAGRGRIGMPEVRGGERERRTGPYQPDFRSRGLRRGVSAQSGGAWRKQRQLRLCRRSPAAGKHRQCAALADLATSRSAAGACLSGFRSTSARLWRRDRRTDFIDRAGRPARRGRHRAGTRGRARVAGARRPESLS